MNKFYWILLFNICILSSCGDTHYTEVEKYYKSGLLEYRGNIDKNGYRCGFWIYQDTLRNKIKGNYVDGFKKGVWTYDKKVYNGKNSVFWNIDETKLFKFNLPDDFEIKEYSHEGMDFIQAEYKDSIELNLNFIILDKKDLETKNMREFLIEETKKNAEVRVLEEKNITVNDLNALRIIYEYSLFNNEAKAYFDQYLINSLKNDCYYLVSCYYPKEKESADYHRIFSEILFSIQEK